MTWHSTRAADALPCEPVGEAIRAGGRYIAASPVLRVILARAGLFIVFASAICLVWRFRSLPQAHLERVRELTDPDHPVVITHWLAVSSRKLPGSPAKPT